MFKISSMITALVLSSVSFAGTHGGGTEEIVFAPESMGSLQVQGPSIVFHMGEANGVVKFATGTLENGAWNVQMRSVSQDELAQDPVIASALSESNATGDWSEVK